MPGDQDGGFVSALPGHFGPPAFDRREPVLATAIFGAMSREERDLLVGEIVSTFLARFACEGEA